MFLPVDDAHQVVVVGMVDGLAAVEHLVLLIFGLLRARLLRLAHRLAAGVPAVHERLQAKMENFTTRIRLGCAIDSLWHRIECKLVTVTVLRPYVSLLIIC